jgi:hypothetical protein
MSNQPPPPQGWQQPPTAPGPPPYGYVQQPPQPAKGRVFAITALVLGIVGSCFGLIPILGVVALPLGIVGLVFGILAISGARKGVRPGKGMAIAGTVLSVLAVVLAIIGFAIVDNAFNDLGHSMNNIAGENTEEILQNDLDVQLGQFVTDGNTFVESGKMTATFRNKGDKNTSFSIGVEAVAADGSRIAYDTAYLENLAPGQSVQKDMFVLVTSDKY